MTTKLTLGQCSSSGDAVLATSYADDFTTRGNAFLFEKIITIANGATAYVLWDYNTYDPANSAERFVYVFPPYFQTTGGPVTVNLYRGTDYSGGVKFNAYNPNVTVKKLTSETTLSLGPTGTNKGTLTMEYLVGGTPQGSFSAPGSTNGLAFFIRKNQGKALVEIVNGAGAEIKFHYGQVFYEI